MISTTGGPIPAPVSGLGADGWIAGEIVAPAAALSVEQLVPAAPHDH